MEISKLNERITIEKNAVVTDAIGNHKNTWTHYFSCYAYASTYQAEEKALLDLLREKEGSSSVIIYLKKEKAKKILPANWNVQADEELLGRLTKKLGEKNIRLVEKRIEKRRKMG